MEIPQCYKALGSAVAALRKTNKMSQVALANAIGLSRASIANIERGRQKVLLHHVYLMAVTLGCESIVELIPASPQAPADAPKVKGPKNASRFTSKEIAQAMNVFRQASPPNKGR